MKRISSKNTFFYKKVFPVIWFGFLLLFLSPAVLRHAVVAKDDAMLLVGPCVLAVFGYFLMRKIIWDLVDEVYDCGEYLLIRNKGMEHQVPLSEIMNVDSSTMMNPPRITLRLATPDGPLGFEVAFSPETPFTLNFFARSAIAEDLIVRIDKARSRRTV